MIAALIKVRVVECFGLLPIVLVWILTIGYFGLMVRIVWITSSGLFYIISGDFEHQVFQPDTLKSF